MKIENANVAKVVAAKGAKGQRGDNKSNNKLIPCVAVANCSQSNPKQSNISNINIFAVVFVKKDFRCSQRERKSSSGNSSNNNNIISIVLLLLFWHFLLPSKRVCVSVFLYVCVCVSLLANLNKHFAPAAFAWRCAPDFIMSGNSGSNNNCHTNKIWAGDRQTNCLMIICIYFSFPPTQGEGRDSEKNNVAYFYGQQHTCVRKREKDRQENEYSSCRGRGLLGDYIFTYCAIISH